MTLFKSFLIGGFECSTHYGLHRKRLDLLASTKHDRFAVLDYARLHEYEIYTVREGVRWYRIETTPGHYRFADALILIRAAEETGTQVLWDLLYFGYPDYVDLFTEMYIPFADQRASKR